MRKDDVMRLRHMLDSAAAAITFTKNKSRKNLDKNRQLVFALVKAVEIIGEAASKTTEETQKNLPDIPWHSIIGMRNRLIHAYFDIDLDILWKTVKEDIPPLVADLKKALSRKK